MDNNIYKEICLSLQYMTEPKIVPQKKFETLGEFREGQNNFYAYFLEDNPFGEVRRDKPHFKRFQQKHGDLEAILTKEVTTARSTKKEFSDETWKGLYEAYNLMSEMVYEDDEGVKRYSYRDQYLTS